MSEKADYFDFVTEVLGVKSILLDEKSVASGELKNTVVNIPLLIAIEDYTGYTKSENELLTKMISALKISSDKLKIIDFKDLNSVSSEYQLLFLNEGAGSQLKPSGAHFLKTYSPKFLNNNPNFKKQAWDELQAVIKYFSVSN